MDEKRKAKEKILQARETGMTYAEMSRRTGLGLRSFIRWCLHDVDISPACASVIVDKL